MKNALLVIAMVFGSQFALAHDNSTISTAKIAELSAHRVDRLVTLGKIDAAFVSKIERIEVVAGGMAPVAYKAVVSQTHPQSGTPLQLELQFDHDGKPLSFKVLSGGTAGADMQWTPKNAGELIENGMHYVLENAADATVAPYFKDFSSLVLVKGTLVGKAVALVQVAASSQAKRLNIYVNLDGSLNSVEVEP